MKRLLPFAAASVLLFSACRGNQNKSPVPTNATSSESASEQPEVTRNVTYRGTVEVAGISVYMEGTHRLELPDGRILLLQSSTVDLNGYVGEDVFVTGDIRPTTEAGGIIMDVKLIALAEPESSSSSVVSSVSSEDMSSAAPSSAPVSSAPVAMQTSSVLSSRAASSAVSEAVSSVTPPSQAAEERSTLMAKDDMGQGSWTQQYCSSHIGFCVPVHKSWWFKSFGTTTSYLWHVEISSEEINNLGDGPLMLNLVSGGIESAGVADRELRAQGDYVVGYRAWTDNRHFEITAPTKLRTAVQYITDNLAVYDSSQ